MAPSTVTLPVVFPKQSTLVWEEIEAVGAVGWTLMVTLDGIETQPDVDFEVTE